MPFVKVREKTVSVKPQKAFWRDWKAGRKVRKIIDPLKDRTVMAVSKTVLGTVRGFSSRKALLEYIARQKSIEKALSTERQKIFVLQPTRVLAINGKLLLEQVYRAPNLSELIDPSHHSRYWDLFEKRLAKKGINLKDKKIVKDLSIAAGTIEYEILKIKNEHQLDFDSDPGNILVHDFDPKTKRFLISIVDIGAIL